MDPDLADLAARHFPPDIVHDNHRRARTGLPTLSPWVSVYFGGMSVVGEIKDIIATVAAGRALTLEQAREAFDIMMSVHRSGLGVAGIYTHDVAQTKLQTTQRLAEQHEFPLLVTMEPEPGQGDKPGQGE